MLGHLLSKSPLWLLCLQWTRCVRGGLYERPTQLSKSHYDYIIVGGGTAGNVVASRLSEDENVTVLVLEAGIAGFDVLGVQVPLLRGTLSPGTPYDWNYTTVVQSGLLNRSIPYARGKILGGSSAINYLVYNRGSVDDWSGYAAIAQDSSFEWHNMQHYMKLNEVWVKTNTNRSLMGEYNASAHFLSGKLGVSLPPRTALLDARVIAATHELPEEFPYQIDMNAGNPIGVGWAQSTIAAGQRTYSATAYLGGEVLERKNLDVLVHAHVTQLLVNGKEKGVPIFRSVEFVSNITGQTYRVHAKKEVVVSAGSFNTPQLLMLSGIGDPQALSKFSIKTQVALPSVGQNMSDHSRVNIAWVANTTGTIQDALDPNVLPDNIRKWQATHKGPLIDIASRQIGWFRLPHNDSIFELYDDPTPGPTSAHYELLFTNGYNVAGGQPIPGKEYMTVVGAVISPLSRGTVTLNSSDPFQGPNINPNLLGSPFDAYVLVQALKAAQRFTHADAFKGYIVKRSEEWEHINTDAELEHYARQNAGTVWHAVGTASMSPRGASWGVVDPDMKVKGTIGLRIVDASVLPHVPTGHTQGPVYLMAERAAALIRQGP